jgi:hypothetical protein
MVLGAQHKSLGASHASGLEDSLPCYGLVVFGIAEQLIFSGGRWEQSCTRCSLDILLFTLMNP